MGQKINERNRIKVAHVITRLDLGGAQHNTLYTIRNLDRDRYVTLLISGVGGVMDKEVRGDYAKYKTYFVRDLVNQINIFKHIKALFRMASIFRRERPAIVHTHCPIAGVLGRWAAYIAKVPVIIHTFHGFGFNDYQWWGIRRFYILIEKVTARVTHEFIMVSEENLRKAIQYKIAKPYNSVIIHSGIELERFASIKEEDIKRTKKTFGIEEDEIVVGMIAPLKSGKAPEDFVKLAEIVSRVNPDTKFILVGDGILFKKIEYLIEKKRLSKKIIMAGWRKDIPAILHIFDIFVLTTLHEGLPRSMVEAMAAGKPVVTTGVGGIKDIIIHRNNGLLVEPHDIETMAGYINTLIKDKGLASRLGNEGKKSLGELFDIDRMVKNVEIFYDHAVENICY